MCDEKIRILNSHLFPGTQSLVNDMKYSSNGKVNGNVYGLFMVALEIPTSILHDDYYNSKRQHACICVYTNMQYTGIPIHVQYKSDVSIDKHTIPFSISVIRGR